jgi:hypothetical protein
MDWIELAQDRDQWKGSYEHCNEPLGSIIYTVYAFASFKSHGLRGDPFFIKHCYFFPYQNHYLQVIIA